MTHRISAPVIVLLLAFVVATPARAQDPEQEETLRLALEDLESRDPETAQRLGVLLESQPDEARKHLERHARYLREMKEAAKIDPARHEAMKQQERLERSVRELIAEHRTAEREGDAGRRVSIRSRLKVKLGEWFDLRQRMRGFQLRDLKKELEKTEQQLETEQTDQRLQSWIDRIVAGGPEAMQERMEELKLITVSPAAAIKWVAKRDPEAARGLATLLENDPKRFHQRIKRAAKEHPELRKYLARKADGPEVEMRRIVAEAHRVLLPFCSREGARIPTSEKRVVRRAVERVVEAERKMIENRLAEVKKTVAKGRTHLERRRQLRSVIIDMKLSELVGNRELYAW